MYARLLALVCLIIVSACMMCAESASATADDIALYFRVDPASSPASLLEMKQELNALMQQGGFRIEWRDLRSGQRDADAAHVAVVEFRGVCAAQQEGGAMAPIEHLPPLASTSVADGRVLPFSWVDCSALSRFLGSSLRKESKTRRNQVYGRAVARLVAHEIYHIVARTEEHTRAGIAKPRFTLSDLLSEHLEFEDAALARLRLREATDGACGDVGQAVMPASRLSSRLLRSSACPHWTLGIVPAPLPGQPSPGCFQCKP